MSALAFRIPESNVEWTFYAYRTHWACAFTHFVVRDGVWYGLGDRPEECGGCLDRIRDHDPGDEDRGR